MTALQAILPQHSLSRLVGRLAQLERPIWLKNFLIRSFMSRYDIDLAEATCSSSEDFPHFNAFFTRSLREGVRPLADSQWCHPADGVLSQCGTLSSSQLVQAKGRTYSVRALLAGSEEEASRFAKGCFATTYLSPRDYHRVHIPIRGHLVRTRYVPGDLFSVNSATVERVDGLLARNERLVCFFETDRGSVAVVMVGAMIVAGIATVWGGREPPGAGAIREQVWNVNEAPLLEAGQEMGRFFLGSTVVLVTEAADLQWADQAGDAVKVRSALTIDAPAGHH
ncbi:MAG: archaetidylserine decarboxylase [Luminiphilus sp.]|nr:archaetidylserine decarboxylase [Luminiphilus sp.]MDG2037317.1 archaetidylserine decarboxylase [Luminiphilus sp.]